MRLIDADELLTAFPVGDEPMVTIACIRATIKHMPTIDPKIVRKGDEVKHGNDQSTKKKQERTRMYHADI